ncbi:MAG: hypothetical protein ACYST0_09015 [Planctomycetota bacterium]|jgi:hypothetical protein
MIKTAFLLAGVSGLFLFASPRLVYSAIQAQQPVGTAFKMTPDPSNIWSFHETVTLQKRSSTTVPVVVDFDADGKMDTQHAFARLLITDLQTAAERSYDEVRVVLRDNIGPRWRFGTALGGSNPPVYRPSNVHLTTPLSIPVGSDLKVDISNPGLNPVTVQINIIGRLVTL